MVDGEIDRCGAAGPGAFFDFAVAELVELFGSGIHARLRLLVDLDPGENVPWELVIDAPDTASARSRRQSMIVWDRRRWKPEGDPQKGLGKGIWRLRSNRYAAHCVEGAK